MKYFQFVLCSKLQIKYIVLTMLKHTLKIIIWNHFDNFSGIYIDKNILHEKQNIYIISIEIVGLLISCTTENTMCGRNILCHVWHVLISEVKKENILYMPN